MLTVFKCLFFQCSLSVLDSESKFQMLTLSSAAILVYHIGTATRRPHTRLRKCARNIWTNISTLRQRAHLKHGELSCLFIFYNITISWLYPLNSFEFIFYCVIVKTPYKTTVIVVRVRKWPWRANEPKLGWKWSRSANNLQIEPNMSPDCRWSPYWIANDFDQTIRNGMDGGMLWIENWPK